MRPHPLVFGFLAAFLTTANAEPFPPASPQFITVDENQLKLDGLPESPQLSTVSLLNANEFLAAVQQEGIEGRYIVGSCEDRAHFISLMARKAGVSVGKVWAIAPARYTLLSRELFRVADPSGVVEHVKWGHHVAPVMRVDYGNGNIRNVVIDLAFNDRAYLPINEWTSKLGSPRGLFFFSGVNDYMFNSLDDLQVFDNRASNDLTRKPSDPAVQTMPRWMPNILTGDIMKYVPATHNAIIAAGMAQDDVAMRIFSNLSNYPASDRIVLKNLIRSEDGIGTIVSEAPVKDLAPQIQTELQKIYRSRVTHWATRLTALEK